jgi:Ca2+-binding RTX toxin-like protein
MEIAFDVRHAMLRGSAIRTRLVFVSALSLLVAILPGALGTPARAAVTCTFASSEAQVTLMAIDDQAVIRRDGNAIEVNGAQCQAAAGPDATVNNTDRITVTGDAQAGQQVVLDLGGGPFAPGNTPEASGRSEIEFEVNLGGGVQEMMTVVGSDGPNTFRFGANAMMLNGDGDVDLSPMDVPVVVRGRGGNDFVSGAGGSGTGPRFPRITTLEGGPGSDRLRSGEGAELFGQGGNDVLIGGPRFDLMEGGAGNDRERGGGDRDIFRESAGPNGADDLSGGPGPDDVSYQSRQRRVVITLDGVANDGDPMARGGAGERDNVRPNIEALFGGEAGDRLVGTAGPQDLFALSGPDLLLGGPGPDFLLGGLGKDRLFGAAGDDFLFGIQGNDLERGGAGRDTFVQSQQLKEGYPPDGSDDLGGGSGRDEVSYRGRDGNLRVTLDGAANDGDPAARGGAGERDNVRADIERVIGGSGQDRLIGNGGPNYLEGLGGSDTLRGRGGSDVLDARDGMGDPEVDGGPGTDTCRIDIIDGVQGCEVIS